MESERVLAAANSAVKDRVGRYLTDVEMTILQGALTAQTYEKIAEKSGYSLNYLKQDVGPKLWKLLGQALEEEVSKTNFRAALERYQARTQTAQRPPYSAPRPGAQGLQSQAANTATLSSAPPLPASPAISRTDWGEAIDVSVFYGRAAELAQLSDWVVADRCRLVAIVGMGGMGKTALAMKLAQQVQPQFDYVIWRSLRNAPPLETLLADLVPFVSHQADTKAELGRLLHWMRSHRCLLVLDNLETLLDAERAGEWRAGYEGYGELLRLSAETQHQSCVLVTSREQPHEIGVLEGIGLTVRSHRLSGSPEATAAILQAKGTFGSEQQRQTLGDRYSHSPLALKIVATSIQSLFEGDIAAFLAEDTLIFNGIRRLLDQQFERLSPLEQTVMYWLAINREWTAIAELHDDIVPAIAKPRLLEALEALNGRSLIETRKFALPGPAGQDPAAVSRYTQQPVVMEYVTSRLIEQACTELLVPLPSQNRSPLVQTHALLKAQSRDYIQASQRRLILQPVLSQLAKSLGSTQQIEQHFQALFQQLRETPARAVGYLGGNILNLLVLLGVDLTGYDLSHLTLWQAALQPVELRQVNLTHADLSKSVLSNSFGGIHSIVFSPDGSLLAAGDSNGVIRLWRTSDSQPVQVLQGHQVPLWIPGIAFSPDGTQLLSGSMDATVKLWDIQTGACLKTLTGHTAWIWSVAFSRDGRTLASSGDDQTIRLWDAATGACLHTLSGHTNWVWAIAFAPNSATLASGSYDNTIRLWDRESGTCLQVLTGHQNSVWALAYSPDGKTLVSGSLDHSVRLWDTATGECLAVLEGHQKEVRGVAVSPDGQLIASGSFDCTVKLWDMATRECVKTLQGHTAAIRCVSFSPDGQIVSSGDNQQTAKLWDVASGQCIKTLQGYANWVWTVAFAPSLTRPPDDGLLASGGLDQAVRLWSLKEGRCTHLLRGHTNWIWAVAFSADGRFLVSSCDDETIKVWDLATGECVRTLQGHRDGGVWSVALTRDGKTLISGGQDGTLRFWDLASGECDRTLPAHSNWIWAIALSPDEQYLVSGSDDQTLKVWCMDTGACHQVLQESGSKITALAFGPQPSNPTDPTLLATGGNGRTLKLWDFRQGTCLKTLVGHEADLVMGVAFSPDGQTLASGGEDATVRLWNVSSGDCSQVLMGHYALVRSVAFSTDGRWLASSSADETIKIWDTQTGKCTQTLRPDRPYEGMTITGLVGITEAQRSCLIALGATAEG